MEKIRTLFPSLSFLIPHVMGFAILVLIFLVLARPGTPAPRAEPHNAFDYRFLTKDECTSLLERIVMYRPGVFGVPTWVWIDESPEVGTPSHASVVDTSDGSVIVMDGERKVQILESHLTVPTAHRPVPGAIASDSGKLTGEACRFAKNDIHTVPKKNQQ